MPLLAALAAVLSVAGLASARASNPSHILVIEDDGRILTPPDPVPLAGRRLSFTPLVNGGYATHLGPARGLLRPGTRIDFDDSASAARVQLRTPFAFYGELHTEVFIHAQGALSFGEPIAASPRAAAGGELLPGLLGGPPVVAALWNELQTAGLAAAKGVFVDQRDDALVVTWYQVPSVRPAAGDNTFRITLSSDGGIDVDYGPLATRWGVVGLSPGAARQTVRMVDFAATPDIAPRQAALAWYRDLPMLNEIALARRVYERIPDRFQFLGVFTTQPVDGPSPVWSTTVQNAERGIGMPIFDHSALFGSRALEHVVVMNDLAFYDDDPLRPPRLPRYAYAPSTLAVLAHETGHRWLAYAGAIDADLAGTDGHWSYTFASGASFLGGNELHENEDGSFTTVASMRSYGALDLYLMGLAPPEDVEGSFVVDDAYDFVPERSRGGEWLDADSHPEDGVTFKGTRRDVTAEGVIERAGVREPDSTRARRSFRMAMVLVVPAGTQPDPAQVAKLERIRRGFGPFFAAATGHRARMQTWLPYVDDNLPVQPDAALISGRPRLLDASVHGDAAGRSEVVLDYADYDADLTSLEVTTDASRGMAPTVVDVALGTVGNRRGSVSFALRDLPADATALDLSLVDNRGLRSRALVRLPVEESAGVVAAR
ncbi:MAG: hypothetical protein AB1689_14375 [Thermodesulfobacteriota bacterium]